MDVLYSLLPSSTKLTIHGLSLLPLSLLAPSPFATKAGVHNCCALIVTRRSPGEALGRLPESAVNLRAEVASLLPVRRLLLCLN